MRGKTTSRILLVILASLNLADGGYEVLLKSRQFVPQRGISDATRAKIEAIGGRAHILVQLEYVPTIKQREELEGKGIELLSYVPNKAWFASIASDKAGEIAALLGVRSICQILPEDKIAPSIRQSGVNDYSTDHKGEAKLVVLFFDDVSLSEGSAILIDDWLIVEAGTQRGLILMSGRRR